MKNLKLLGVTGVPVEGTDDPVTHISKCLLSQHLYGANSKGLYRLTSQGENGSLKSSAVEMLSLWSEHVCFTPESEEHVRVVCCNAVDAGVCTILSTGDVIVYNDEEMEVVGAVEDGIEAASWSPDEELLVLVTSEGRLVMLSSMFMPITELNLSEQQFGASSFVTVGWGKKETQFHGTEGKKSRVVGPVVGGLADTDDRLPRISWRGDGQMFAVSYVEREEGCEDLRRRLRVVNREGVLQYTSEVVTKLEQPLSWQPSGSLIASSQRLPNGKYNVVFFEKNGLRHGEFTLKTRDQYIVKELLWNNDSTVLAVWLTSANISGEDNCHEDYLQLWTVSNYYWHLKEELSFNKIFGVLWDIDNPLKLSCVTSKSIEVFTWTFCVHKSKGKTLNDNSLVTVISGDKLHITPFRKCNIPPPMSAYTITFPGQIQAVAFPSFADNSDIKEKSLAVDSNCLCALHNGFLSVMVSTESLEELDNFGCTVDYRCGRSAKFKVTFPVHKVVQQFDFRESLGLSEECNLKLSNLVWLQRDVYYFLIHDLFKNIDYLCSIEVHGSELSVKKISLPSSSFMLCTGYLGTLYLQNSLGELFVLTPGSDSVLPLTDKQGAQLKFSSPCPEMDCHSVDGEICVFGLSARNRLYFNSVQLASNCSSFHIHDEFLLMTMTNHKLCTIPLNNPALSTFIASGSSQDCERNLERGSKIVTTFAEDCQVVIQMPRGNLETIYPRQLLIHNIKNLLIKRSYLKSMELMRKHRVDMNLLYDHNPDDFVKYCTDIVSVVGNATWIDLFIAGLKNEDTTKSLYQFNYDTSSKKTDLDCKEMSKIDFVCTTIRDAMIKVDETKYLLPILTSFVKMDNNQMDLALKKVKEIKDSADTNQLEVSAEEGLRHLLYIADANTLCDVALGTYDFDLVMMVFKKSQKDPKEFLPFLNKLIKMEENYMKYTINVYLKRYRKAFEAIKNSEAEHVSECLSVVKKEKLFSIALEEFIPGSPLYLAVAEVYANYNIGKGFYGEAALLYERADKLADALDAYQQLGNWRRVFVTASKLKYSKDEMLELYYTTIENLKDNKKFADAAVIYRDYIRSEEDAVECCVLAHQWDEALRIIYQHQRLDLIETNLLPELLQQTNNTIQEIEDITEKFTAHCDRLKTVRENLDRKQQDILDGNYDALDEDMYCDSSSTITGASNMSRSRGGGRSVSGGSSVSGRTYRSSKNRKKLERKKYSTKEGSTYEDLGLIAEIHSLIVRADGLAEPISSNITTLYSFSKDALATKLQLALHTLLRFIEKKEKEIWPNVECETGEPGEEFGAHLSTNEMIKQKQQLANGLVANDNSLNNRMKQLEPSFRYCPKPTRKSTWALGFLHKKKDL